MMGWYNNGGMDTGSWIIMMVMMSLFWGAVIVAGAMLFRGVGNTRGRRDDAQVRGATYSRSPLDILDERFARGELGNEEYEARRAVLLDSYAERP